MIECEKCKRSVPIENRDLGLCATCNHKLRKNSEIQLYYAIKPYFLAANVRAGKKCPVTGRPITMNSDIHHMMGRNGYADMEKKRAGIRLLYDPDFFLAVSRDGHNAITDDSKGAIERGWSVSRMNVIPK